MSQATVELVLPDLVPPPPVPPPPAPALAESPPAPPSGRSRPAGQPATEIRPRARPSSNRARAAARLAGADPDAAAAAAAAAEWVEAVPSEPDQPGSDSGPKQRHLRVVESPKLNPAQRRRRARAVVLGGAGLLAAIAFGLVYLHVVLAQRQFTLDKLTTQVQAQQLSYEKLRLRVAQLGSPQNVISTAVGKLGMHQPTSVNFLQPTTTIGQANTSATPASSTSTKTTTVTAPAGDANWPQIKSQLAGSP